MGMPAGKKVSIPKILFIYSYFFIYPLVYILFIYLSVFFSLKLVSHHLTKGKIRKI